MLPVFVTYAVDDFRRTRMRRAFGALRIDNPIVFFVLLPLCSSGERARAAFGILR